MYKYRSNCIILSILILSFFCMVLEANANSIESFPIQNSRFDSLNVKFIGSWPFSGYAYAVASDSARDLMFLGSGAGVYILDVSDPQNPVKISEQIHARDHVHDLFYIESVQYLYIANSRGGLEIWDITDPVLPQKLGFCHTPEYAVGIHVQDTFAYVVDNHDLRIIDVTNPTDPYEAGYCSIPGYAGNVHVAGSYAYIATEYTGLMVVDVSTPSNPQIVGICDTMYSAQDVFVVGTYAYITGLSSYAEDTITFHVIDISDPANPYEINRLILGTIYAGYWQHTELYVRDSFAYIIGEEFTILNISDFSNLYLVGTCNEWGYSVSVSGDYAYIASPQGPIMDISIPSDPQVVGHYEIPYTANDVHVSEPYAYVADSHKGLYILDISSPANPFEVGNCQIGSLAYSIYTVGDYAYLPYKISYQDSMHLAVIDISNPLNPQHIGDCQADYPNDGAAKDIHVLGSYAYVTIRNNWTGGQGGLWIVDVSDPSNPQGVGYFEDPQVDHKSSGVYVVDTLAYLAANDFYVINVSDPSNPQQVGYCSTRCRTHDVHVSGSHAYVVDGYNNQYSGLRVIDISDPINPHEVGYYPIADELGRLHVSDNYAYVTNLDGLRIIDVSAPSNPQLVGYYTITNGYGVYTLYPYIYMAAGALGLQIYENLLPGIEETCVTPMESNFLGATIFNGPLLLPADKSCRVFDITGRVVMPNKIKTGIYFIEIDGKVTTKVIKIK